MKTLIFKNNDAMPILGLGTWKSAPGEVYTAVREAIKIGYRHIDCAAIYGNEKEIGSALADAIRSGEVERDQLWITSKLWNNAHGKDRVLPALEQTLKDLRLDYLDLYLVHWPVALKASVVFPGKGEDFVGLDELPIAETWQGMEASVQKGLSKHIGVSNFSTKKLYELAAASDLPPEMNQIELHPFLQQKRMLAYCTEHNVHLTAYCPLGSGDRPAALKNDNEKRLLENATVLTVARQHNCSAAQVLICWAIERGTAVIPKSVNPTRLAENFKSFELSLSTEEMEILSELDAHARYVNGEFWTVPGSPYTLENLWD